MLTLPELATKLNQPHSRLYQRLKLRRRHNPDFGRKIGRDWVVTEAEAAELSQKKKAGRKPHEISNL